MGKIEEKRERWYKAGWGKVSLTAKNSVLFNFDFEPGSEDTFEIPIDEWREIVKFIKSESRRELQRKEVP